MRDCFGPEQASQQARDDSSVCFYNPMPGNPELYLGIFARARRINASTDLRVSAIKTAKQQSDIKGDTMEKKEKKTTTTTRHTYMVVHTTFPPAALRLRSFNPLLINNSCPH